MNIQGFTFALKRLFQAPHQKAMKDVWATLGDEYQTDPSLRWFAKELAKLKPEDGKRGLNQNALLHKWYAEIAKHRGDCTAKDVKGECHQKHALVIRLRDPSFAWVWEKTGAHLDYEKQCALLASEVLAVSSGMSKPEMTEYMDAIQAEFAHVRLTMPEAA